MMALPTLGYQTRNLGLVQGQPSYQIETVITAKGDLPDIHAFLMRVNDRADADRDTLERVCTVTDLTDYVPDRINALLLGQSLYRVSATIVRYRSIDVAIAAQTLIQEQVTRLTLDYRKFLEVFSTQGFLQGRQYYSWPLFGADVVARLRKAYCDARALAEAQDTTIATQQELVASYSSRLSVLLADETALKGVRAQQAQSITALAAVQAQQGTALQGALTYTGLVKQGLAAYTSPNPADAFFGVSGSVSNAQAGQESSLVAAQAALQTLSTTQQQLQAAIAALDAAIAAKTSEAQSVQTLRDAATVALTQQQAVLVGLRQGEATALGALIAADPNFDVVNGCCC